MIQSVQQIIDALNAYLPLEIDPEMVSRAWVQALLQAEALQIGIILLSLFVARGMRNRVQAMRIPFSKRLENLIHTAAWPLSALFLLIISRGLLTSATLPVTYLDIAGLFVAAWGIYQALRLFEFTPGARRLLALILFAIPALMVTDKLGTVIAYLDSAKLPLGDTPLSVWTVLKAVFLFSLLVWAFTGATRMLDSYMLRMGTLTPSARTLLSKMTNIIGLTMAFLIALNLIGIDLTTFAFIGGALGIGIGFGLRAITSNFISGIILLMDKSIKPGDVITVGDTFGVVEALHSRYVVLRRRDGMEVLMPNENLMISEVMNWSYSNRKIRHALQIGVSYASDMEQVQDILLEAAKANPRVLDNPDPKAYIMNFGDSAVLFELRFWLLDPEAGLGNLRSELYMDIWKRFKETGVEIPFPQRVLHMAHEEQPTFSDTSPTAPESSPVPPAKTGGVKL